MARLRRRLAPVLACLGGFGGLLLSCNDLSGEIRSRNRACGRFHILSDGQSKIYCRDTIAGTCLDDYSCLLGSCEEVYKLALVAFQGDEPLPTIFIHEGGHGDTRPTQDEVEEGIF